MRLSFWVTINASLLLIAIINFYALKPTNFVIDENEDSQPKIPIQLKKSISQDIPPEPITVVVKEIVKEYVEVIKEVPFGQVHGRHIYIITPTYPRIVQRADLVRMTEFVRSATLGGNATWVVIDDANITSIWTEQFLQETQLPEVIYTNQQTPPKQKKTTRGVSQRNKGLRIVYDKVCSKHYESIWDYPIIYFADDDNTYDYRLWNLLRENVVRVAVANVGLITSTAIPIEGPKFQIYNTSEFHLLPELTNSTGPVKCGASLTPEEREQVFKKRPTMSRIVGWSTMDKRAFPIDMAGFAISARELCKAGVRNATLTNLAFHHSATAGLLETNFISQILPDKLCAYDPLSLQGIGTNQTLTFHTRDAIYKRTQQYQESWLRNGVD